MGCGGSKTAARTPRTGRGGQGAGNRRPSKKKQPINEKGYKKRIRENLRHAAAGNDIDELNKCMEVFVNNHMEDGGDYVEAEKRLEFLLLRKEIRDACLRRHPVVLDKSIQKVESSAYKRQLKPYLERAYYLKQHQNELDTTDEPWKFRHDISHMDQSTVSEVRSYHRPPPGVHHTMVATYMILGYPENHLVDWTEVTALMGRYGKDSLLREVQVADTGKIDNTTALRARNYLGQYSLEEVRAGSNGAAAFYVWSSRMVGKYDGKGKKGVDTTPKKLINTGGTGQQPSNKAENHPKSPSTQMKPAAIDKGKAKQQIKQQTKQQQQNTAKQQQQTAAKQQKDNKTKQANGAVKTANNTAAKTNKKG